MITVFRNLGLTKVVGLVLLIAGLAYATSVGLQHLSIKFKGQNTEAGPLSLGNGESPDCLNVHTSVYGNLVKRSGYTEQSYSHTHISSSPGKCNGLFDFAVDTTTREVMGYFDSTLYYVDTTNDGWFQLDLATAMTSDIMEFENFDGTLILVTWSRDTGQSWDGSATTTSDIASMPTGRHIVRAYNRMFVLNVISGGTVYPLRFYFSNAGSYTTWTTGTDYETLDASQGDEGMGWGLLKGRLFGFSKYTVNLVSDVGGSNPMQVTRRLDGIGCGAPRTIKTVNSLKTGESLMWLSQDKKLYSWSGSTLKEISLRIDSDNNLAQVYMERINDTNLKYCHAVVYEARGWYVLFIPITANVDYAIVYDYNTDTLWSFSNQNFWSSAVVETSTGKQVYVGEAGGDTHQWDYGQSDNGSSINSYWTSRRWDFGAVPYLKKMGETRVITKTLGDYPLYYQYRYNFDSSWSTKEELTMISDEWLLGDALPATLGGREAQVHRLTIPGAFNLFQIKLSDSSSNPAWEIYGLDVTTNATGGVDE